MKKFFIAIGAFLVVNSLQNKHSLFAQLLTLLAIYLILSAILDWFKNKNPKESISFGTSPSVSSKQTNFSFRPPTQKIEIPVEILDSDPEFQNIIRMVQSPAQIILLTGKAGTGKSTGIHYIRRKLENLNIVTIAPTGVAAINVMGQTIHSFFKLPARMIFERDVRFQGNQSLYKKIDLLIIDEVSMVRADLMDAIDSFLRKNGRDKTLPFGGIKVLMVGDLFQLPPVLKRKDKEIFHRFWKNRWFFGANCFSKIKPTTIELKTIHRQKDTEFISLLENIRYGRNLEPTLLQINKTALENSNVDENFAITLATRNSTVEAINIERLERLAGDPSTYNAIKTGTFLNKENNEAEPTPAPSELKLKIGSQVMLLRNDREKRWANGSLARIIKLNKNRITVQIYETGLSAEIEPVKWEDIEYKLDEDTGKIKPTVVGEFIQIPVKLAWAWSIHKAQGQTFNQVIIDLEEGAFDSGMAYVALSRCRDLDFIKLVQPLKASDVIVDTDMVGFTNKIGL